ncbi:MAG: hypothetical protein ACI9WC_002788, partial [Arenicella sp.]
MKPRIHLPNFSPQLLGAKTPGPNFYSTVIAKK